MSIIHKKAPREEVLHSSVSVNGEKAYRDIKNMRVALPSLLLTESIY